MRLLFIGDVFGRTGREAIQKHLPKLQNDLDIDFTIVDGDNAAHGRGITEKICKELYDLNVDCITSGDHVWDQREIMSYISRDKNLIRPMNYKAETPGVGSWEKQLPDGRSLVVLHLQCRVFMKPIEDPFAAADEFLKTNKISKNKAIFVDFHGEATSEKMALGQYLDGRVSAVVGSHTHIPTADCQILPNGTGYQTDAGMTGDYDSVIGAQKEGAIARLTKDTPRPLQPAEGEATLCGTFIEIDDMTGLTLKIEPIRIGGRLSQALPGL